MDLVLALDRDLAAEPVLQIVRPVVLLDLKGDHLGCRLLHQFMAMLSCFLFWAALVVEGLKGITDRMVEVAAVVRYLSPLRGLSN